MSAAPVRVGISACLFHADPARPVFHGKPLYFLERSMARWVASLGAVVYLVPDPSDGADPAAHARDLDGLVLQGGVDVSPRSYGEEPLRPEWNGDAERDAYEMRLVRGMLDLDKPVLGVCRGHQLLNVIFGGTLYQDILTQVGGARVHRDAEIYDRLAHEMVIEPGSSLAALYPASPTARINSVHHQAIKDLGRGVVVEARSASDGIIEAMRVEGPAYVRGVQWHPEFVAPEDTELLDGRPLLASFVEACAARRERSK